MKRISLIIVTYNSSKHIYDCLDSVFKYNDIGDDLEIIVVDNHSNELETMFKGIRARYADKVLLIDSGKNGGYGFGNNVGINRASAPIVIVMNPDIRLVQPLFKSLIDIMSDTEIGLAGVTFAGGLSPFYLKPEFRTVKNELLLKFYTYNNIYNPRKMYLSGSFLCFNKRIFHEAGGFDENMFMYYEEPDITNRIINLSKKVILLDGIRVLHLAHGRSFNKYLFDVGNESLIHYCNKYNVSIKKFYKDKIQVYKLKLFCAKIVHNKHKIKLFEDFYNSSLEFYKGLL